jgi:hypothetical protein
MNKIFAKHFQDLKFSPPKGDPPLSVQEGFDILIFEILISPPFEHNRINN